MSFYCHLLNGQKDYIGQQVTWGRNKVIRRYSQMLLLVWEKADISEYKEIRLIQEEKHSITCRLWSNPIIFQMSQNTIHLLINAPRLTCLAGRIICHLIFVMTRKSRGIYTHYGVLFQSSTMSWFRLFYDITSMLKEVKWET